MAEKNIYDYGFNRALQRDFGEKEEKNPTIYDSILDAVSSNLLSSGTLIGEITVAEGGAIKSSNYVAGSAGWIITSAGSLEASTGVFRGELSGASISATSITGGTIQTSASANTGVKLVSSGIKIYGRVMKVYDSSGDWGGDFYSTGAGRATVYGDDVIDLITGSGTGQVVAVATTFRPNTDNVADLGSSTKEWKNLYLDGTAQIDGLQIDQVPTIEALTSDYHILINVNGTTFKLLLKKP